MIAPYNSIAALIGSTLGWRHLQRKATLVLACYLDDSGESGEPGITLAGYVSLAPQWAEFEDNARLYFDDYGIPYLHTVDFHQGKGFFKGWCRQRRAEFANGLFDIVRSHVGLGIEFSVLKSVYHQRKRESQLNKNISAFGFCFEGVLDRLAKDSGVQDILSEPEVDISFIIESGNRNDKDVHDVFRKAQKHPNGKKLKEISFADKKAFIALQISDFLAYYSRRIRVRGPNASHAQDEKDFFVSVTKDLRHVRFLATDFG